MPKRIDDTTRQAILDDIRKRAGRSTRELAAAHGVSDRFVRKIAEENDVTDAWSREQTKNATAASVADSKARRAAISAKFLTKADELLDQIDRPHLVFSFGGKDNTFNQKTLDRPPTGDIRNLMIAAATAFDKHVVAEKHDTDSGADAAKSMLGQLAAGLTTAYEQLMKDDAPDAGG